MFPKSIPTNLVIDHLCLGDKMNALVASLVLLCLTSCIPGMLSIKSTPDKAEVHSVSSNGTSRVLGTTPLEIQIEDIFGPNDQSARLVIQKPGMYRESIVIPKSALPANHDIQVKLTKLEKIEIEKIVGKECSSQEQYQCPSVEKADFSKLARGVATIQSLIAAKGYKDAEMQVNSLITSYPYVAVLHTLLGNSRYLARDFKGAHTAYTRALELDPQNVETRNILSKLQKLVATAAPVGQEGAKR